MKTFIKIAIALIILVAIALAIVFTVVLTQGDNIIKAVIEKGGTYATETTTTVDSVELGLFDGTFAMNGFNIGNPEGFDTNHFLSLSSTAVALDPTSFKDDVISIPTVTFKGLDIILDKGQNPSNYNAILASLQRFEAAKPSEDKPESEPGKTVVIDSLVLEDINIHLANMPGIGFVAGDIAINIPRIELKDVGKEESMGIPEIVNLVVKTVLTAAIESGGGIIPNDILGELGNGLSGLSSLSDMGITAIGSAGQIVGEQMGEVLNEAGKAVENLAENAQDLVKDIPIPEDLGDDINDAVEDATDNIKDGLDKINPFGKKKDP